MGRGFAENQFDQPALLEEASWSNRKGAGQQIPSLSLLPPSQQLLLLPTRGTNQKPEGKGTPGMQRVEQRAGANGERPGLGSCRWEACRQHSAGFVERAWRPGSDCPCFTPAARGGGEGVADGPPRTAEKLK